MKLITTYKQAYSYMFISFVPVILLFFAANVHKKTNIFSNLQKTVLLFAIIPVFMHHALLLPDVMSHEFTVLKFSIFFSLLFGILLSKIKTSTAVEKIIFVLVLGSITFSLKESVNTYHKLYSPKGDQDKYFSVGSAIRRSLNDDEVGFIIEKEVIIPQIIYYAKRNLQAVGNQQEAIEWLIKYKRRSGKIFVIDNDFQVRAIIPISNTLISL